MLHHYYVVVAVCCYRQTALSQIDILLCIHHKPHFISHTGSSYFSLIQVKENERMPFAMNNISGRQMPLGDQSLNCNASSKGGIDRVRVNGLKTLSSGKSYNPNVSSSHLQQSSSVRKNSNYTPNRHRTPGGGQNTSFKSPITLCFDRMLGAGKFAEVSSHENMHFMPALYHKSDFSDCSLFTYLTVLPC